MVVVSTLDVVLPVKRRCRCREIPSRAVPWVGADRDQRGDSRMEAGQSVMVKVVWKKVAVTVTSGSKAFLSSWPVARAAPVSMARRPATRVKFCFIILNDRRGTEWIKMRY